jgi:hypothetical protein
MNPERNFGNPDNKQILTIAPSGAFLMPEAKQRAKQLNPQGGISRRF